MAEIQEVAIQIDDQPETSTETNQDSTVPEDDLEIYMRRTLNELPGEPFGQRLATIFRLPGSIHVANKVLCEPELVAIGPYHQGKTSYRTMEEHKWYILRDFLARNKNVGLEDYLQAMRSMETQARNCYSETVDMGSDDFVTMLLLDGCFILEWFFLNYNSLGDAFFYLGWASSDIFADMCLLENQVPFFVLHELWSIQNQGVSERPNCEDHCPFLEILCPVLKNYCDFTQFRPPQISCGNIFHLLHLYYTGVVPDSEHQTDQFVQENSASGILHKFCRLGSFLWSKLYSKSCTTASRELRDLAPMGLQSTLPTISELRDAGVKFKRKNNPASMFDISFTNGTFEMPFLQIQAPTIRILWNMVAFEQSRYAWGLQQTLSSYLGLMDTLINTDKDVVILEQSGIFDNFFQNAEEAATFFNQFDKIFCLDYRDHYFKGLFQDVREYSESTWHRHRARLMQDYFSNPWSIISLVAAGILLILTFIQTYYSAAK